MKQKLRVAQIGCNGVANNHAVAHRATGNTELVAVCDAIHQRAEDFAKKHGVAEYSTNAAELFARRDIDLIDIVTPDATHAALAVAAANAGKHVLIEKPIATSLAEIDEIISAVRRNGVKAMCAQSMRWFTKISAFADAIFSGKIGRVVFLRFWGGCSRFWSPQSHPKGEADYLLIHNGMHFMDLITWMTGEYPSSVFTLGHPGQGDVPLWEYFTVNAGFPSGAMALFEENRMIQPQGVYSAVGVGAYAIGEKGTLCIEATGGLSVSMYNRNGVSFPGSHVYAAPCDDNFAGEIRHIAQCVIDDSQPSISLEHSRKVLASLQAAAESFKTNRPVEVCYE